MNDAQRMKSVLFFLPVAPQSDENIHSSQQNGTLPSPFSFHIPVSQTMNHYDSVTLDYQFCLIYQDAVCSVVFMDIAASRGHYSRNHYPPNTESSCALGKKLLTRVSGVLSAPILPSDDCVSPSDCQEVRSTWRQHADLWNCTSGATWRQSVSNCTKGGSLTSRSVANAGRWLMLPSRSAHWLAHFLFVIG